MRLKDVVELVNEKTDRVDRPYVALENIVSWDAKFVVTDAITEGTNACFKAGDVLFGKLRPYLAKGYLPDYDGICSTEFLVMRPHRDINGRYILYWMLSPDFIGVIKNRVVGVKMPRTDWATISQMELTPPSLDSQRRIVAYLDEKTAAINARVAVLEKKLAAYKRLKASVINRAVTRGLDPKAKLKDSGVEWIGKVPAGWDTRRVKDVGSAWNGLTYSPEDVCDEDNGVLVLRSSNIQDGSLDYTDCVYVDCNVANLARVKRGDVLICSRNGSAALVGKNALIETDVSAAFGAFMLVFRGGREIEKRYAHYVFNAQMFESYMGGFATSTIHQLLRSDFLNMEMPYPPPAEQIAIADYLDAECTKIDKMAELLTREIELYKKLKRSLINEVVTGKRPVFADKPLRRGKEVA